MGKEGTAHSNATWDMASAKAVDDRHDWCAPVQGCISGMQNHESKIEPEDPHVSSRPIGGVSVGSNMYLTASDSQSKQDCMQDLKKKSNVLDQHGNFSKMIV